MGDKHTCCDNEIIYLNISSHINSAYYTCQQGNQLKHMSNTEESFCKLTPYHENCEPFHTMRSASQIMREEESAVNSFCTCYSLISVKYFLMFFLSNPILIFVPNYKITDQVTG